MWTVSLMSAAVAATPVPGLDVAVNVALICSELLLYHNTFGFGQQIVITTDPRLGQIKSNPLSMTINFPSFPNCVITNVPIALLSAIVSIIELALSFFRR
jgi:hypothetical protein